MRDFLLNDEHDISRTNSDIELISGSEETAQNVTVALLTIQGEYIFDLQLGVPWLSGMLGSGWLNIEREYELRKAILSREGVVTITAFSFRIDTATRIALVEYEIETLYGTSKGVIA